MGRVLESSVSYLLFVDESGQDGHESPNEVLAGLTVEDRKLWRFIQSIHRSEIIHFGGRYRDFGEELKGKHLLNRKVFRLAEQLPLISPTERTQLAAQALTDGANPTRHRLTALAQAKLAFVADVLRICADFECRAFASITARGAPRSSADVLRKDYSYLFERYFNYLRDNLLLTWMHSRLMVGFVLRLPLLIARRFRSH